MLAAALLLVTCLGFAFPALVLRTDARSRDARNFALLGLTDATTSATRTILVFAGYSISAMECLLTTGIANVVIAYVSVEFAWSFPGRPRLPLAWRIPLALASLATIVFFIFIPGYSVGQMMVSSAYFTPMGILIMVFVWRNYRALPKAERGGVALVMAALAGRWLVGNVLYIGLYRLSPAAFRIGLIAESTIIVTLTLLLCGYAVLRHHLFRVRGVMVELLVMATAALALLIAAAGGIEILLGNVRDPLLLRAGLIVVALVPAGLVALWVRLKPRLESRLWGAVDPRRALRFAVTERVVRASDVARSPAEHLELTTSALGEMSGGGATRFLRGPAWPQGQETCAAVSGELGGALAARLTVPGTTHLLRSQDMSGGVAAELEQADACLLVPVHVQGSLLGGLAVKTGGDGKCPTIDRDTVMAAVTLSKHLALRLQNWALYSELEESRRLATLGSFAAAIAHDLRTPLTSVQMNVQILRSKVQLPPDDMEYFDIALEELRRLNAHISELLDYAKPVRLDPVPHDLSDVADDAARGIEAVLAERQVSLARDDAPGLPPARLDQGRMRQVLMNLLDNAAKASAPGAAITLRTRAAAAGMVAIEVADEGKGIAPDSLPRIFEPFYTTRPDGTGLGLAIVHKLVRAHQGEIQVRSTVGRGSTFTVLLPAA